VLPHHAQRDRTHITWPLAQVLDKTLGDHGKFDVFFYPLGNDVYSAEVLPIRCHSPGNPFQGIFVVLVKLKFDFDTSNKNIIHDRLNALDRNVGLLFNFSYAARGTHAGVSYAKCLLHFAPRFWVPGYSNKEPTDNHQHFFINVPDEGDAAWESGIFAHREHLDFPLIRPANEFNRFFGQMVGITNVHAASPADFAPIIRDIMADGTVYDA
jgi:hypothetical protein